jgi:quercetin dioxygenase-like cupin family protein
MSAKPVFLNPDEGRTLNVLADRIRVLATGADTGNRYEVFDLTGSEGSGPPPHSHPWDEAYYILEGEVDVVVSGQATRAAPGAFVLAPANAVHTFKIVSPESRFVVMTTGRGASNFFEAMDREIGFPPPSFEKVCEVAMRQGLTLA